MELRLTPETESRLSALAAQTGRPMGDLVEDAMAGYLAELGEVRHILDRRCDDVKSGRVQPISDEEAGARLHLKSEARRAVRS